MAGHSHSSNVAGRKSAVDARKAKLFTKAAKDIIIASRDKGKDPDSNPSLRLAIERAKYVNMPKDKIEYAILRGCGEVPGMVYEEKVYEGYGPGGIAIICDVLTDSINRTASEIKHIFSKNGGNMGEPGCVSWDFKKVGLIIIKGDGLKEDEVMEAALECGASDISQVDKNFEVITEFADFFTVLDSLKAKGYQIEQAEFIKVPGNKIALDVEKGLLAVKLIEILEANPDTQNIYTNLEYTPELIEALSKE